MSELLSARDLMAEPWNMPRAMAYRLLAEIGTRVSPRRVVVLRSRLLQRLGGDEGGTAKGDS